MANYETPRLQICMFRTDDVVSCSAGGGVTTTYGSDDVNSWDGNWFKNAGGGES